MYLKAPTKENALAAFVDTDFAGCHRTREAPHPALQSNAANCGAVLGRSRALGDHAGRVEVLGMNALAEDLGIALDLEVLTDATATIGICRRRGLGRIRHLAVADLWVQDKLRSKDLAFQRS